MININSQKNKQSQYLFYAMNEKVNWTYCEYAWIHTKSKYTKVE